MTHIEIALGSITEQDVEAIVNSANSSLIMGDGVAAAIRRSQVRKWKKRRWPRPPSRSETWS